jgi:hypothetical protein
LCKELSKSKYERTGTGQVIFLKTKIFGGRYQDLLMLSINWNHFKNSNNSPTPVETMKP